MMGSVSGFNLDPSGRPNPDRELRKGVAGRVEIRPQTRVTELGVRGLACPECDMPLVISSSLPWNGSAQCPFCETVAPTREFIRETGWPEVRLVARLG
jgi:hypothetical protein